MAFIEIVGNYDSGPGICVGQQQRDLSQSGRVQHRFYQEGQGLSMYRRHELLTLWSLLPGWDILIAQQASYSADIKVPSRLLTADRTVEQYKLDAPEQSPTSVPNLSTAASARFVRRLATVALRESASRARSARRRFPIALNLRAARALRSTVSIVTPQGTTSRCDVKYVIFGWRSRRSVATMATSPPMTLQISRNCD